MSQAYEMKVLGYPRTKTDAQIRIEFSNGEQWTFPAQLVADDRDENYADDREDTVRFIREGSLELFDLFDWATGSMNWSDVLPYANELPRKIMSVDHQREWINGSQKNLERDL